MKYEREYNQLQNVYHKCTESSIKAPICFCKDSNQKLLWKQIKVSSPRTLFVSTWIAFPKTFSEMAKVQGLINQKSLNCWEKYHNIQSKTCNKSRHHVLTFSWSFRYLMIKCCVYTYIKKLYMPLQEKMKSL